AFLIFKNSVLLLFHFIAVIIIFYLPNIIFDNFVIYLFSFTGIIELSIFFVTYFKFRKYIIA
ncbi:MAG: hypothetical protein CMF80_00630, partial [Candidatus Marinimicrobia bacterium]|nr:hypothetical protein [Candidatus Neomarinimicrobiota bacterium]